MNAFAVYWRSIKGLENERSLAIILVAANIILAIAAFAEPVLFGKIIDALTTAKTAENFDQAKVVPLILMWLGFGLFTILAGVMVAMHADRLSHRQRLGIMSRFYEHILHLPLLFHGKHHSGGLLKIMLEGSGALSGLWLSFLRENCSAFVALMVLLPLSIFLNWRLASLLIVLSIFFAVLSIFIIRKTEKLQSSVEEYHTQLAEQVTDTLGNVPVIQSFTRIKAETQNLKITIDRLLAAQIPVLSWWALAAVATRASSTITVLSILLLGTWLFSKSLASVGDVVTFMSLAGMLISRLEQVVGFINHLMLVVPKIQDFFSVLDTPSEITESENPIALEHIQGEVEFSHVNFAYDQRKPIIKNMSFKVKKGEKIALVGETGSGKSTALALLHRVFDPLKGQILIDGHNIKELSLNDLRNNIGVVFQEPMLFARTIKENLLVGKPDATDQDIQNAIIAAQAKSFIDKLPDGLETIIQEKGRSLSGGERQRLAIARTILKNPPILILDEVTSALDAQTEKKLQLALDELSKNRTTFIIAHRLATIRNCDRILHFSQGEIIEQGSFDELTAKESAFAELAKAQLIIK